MSDLAQWAHVQMVFLIAMFKLQQFKLPEVLTVL